jgi:hypothetical protein
LFFVATFGVGVGVGALGYLGVVDGWWRRRRRRR